MMHSPWVLELKDEKENLGKATGTKMTYDDIKEFQEKIVSKTVLPRCGNDLRIVDAYPVSHPESIIDDVY